VIDSYKYPAAGRSRGFWPECLSAIIAYAIVTVLVAVVLTHQW